ncbi:hypothetical protein EJG51_014415 [Undibacterium piscinae]|uniref:CHASE domain-containing protein n=1 Tax=Undibacterium piscinae TaxID=2495591 RepID=A0A6M4A6N1_9BURK|nr:hypothetical protein EJG51_014415 [Undibacterium piscinae]
MTKYKPGYCCMYRYRHSADIEFLEQRREELIGYVYSPFRMNDLMEGILSGENLQLTWKFLMVLR